MSEFTECVLCSYAIGKSNVLPQAIYTCETCFGDSNVCCCAGCAEFCHKDHDVNFVAFGEAFCDCGHSNCSLMPRSTAEAARILSNPSISFDKNGRIACPDLYVSPFKIDNLIGLDSINTESLKNQCSELVAKSKETFWLGMNEAPRCPLEQLARTIFDHHASHYKNLAGVNPSVSGAEWWVQVKPSTSTTDEMTSDDALEDAQLAGGVDLHYDKDEEIASSFNIGIFPHISTVTYLTEQLGDAPTVVFEAKASDTVGDSIKKCYISIPEVGKHVSFDGRFLHGAPAQFREFSRSNNCRFKNTKASGESSTAAAGSSTVRITFLVNVWLNHHPAAVFPLPEEIVNHLNSTNSVGADQLSLVRFVGTGSESSSGSSSSSSSSSPNTFASIPRFSITTVKVSSRLTGDEDCELGEWVSVPFVSDKTEWGKAEDETGLLVMMWQPSDVSGILSLPPESAARKGPSKKKTKINHNTDTSSSSSNNNSGSGNGSGSGAFSNTFEVVYCDEESVARLQYEEDEEAEEEFADEFNTSL